MEYDFRNVDTLIEKDIAGGFPGAVLHISHNGMTLKHSAYGFMSKFDNDFTELKKPERMEPDTIFDIASNTKIFATTLALLRLASEEKIDINSNLKYYLPELIHPEITLKMLLSHCSGLGPEVWFFSKQNHLGEKFYSQGRERTKKLLLKVPLEYKSGASTVYSDTGFMLLGILIEKITGMELNDAADKLIYKPLGLTETTFKPMEKEVNINRIAATSVGNTCNDTMDYPNIRRSVIRGEVQDEKAYYSMKGTAGHAGLFSTSSDLIKMCDFIRSLYHGETSLLFSEKNFLDFITPSGPDKTFGCGWRINRNFKAVNLFGLRASDMTIGHTGFTGTLSLIDLKNRLSIVLLTNKVHSFCFDRRHYACSDFKTGQYAPVIEEVYSSLNRLPS